MCGTLGSFTVDEYSYQKKVTIFTNVSKHFQYQNANASFSVPTKLAFNLSLILILKQIQIKTQ